MSKRKLVIIALVIIGLTYVLCNDEKMETVDDIHSVNNSPVQISQKLGTPAK